MIGRSSLFVDTAGWGCYLDRADPLRQRAVEVCRQAVARQRSLVTTNYVIAELVALLSARVRLPRPRVITIVDLLKATPHLTIIHVDRATDDDAWALLMRRPDKQWSLVDAASFLVMEAHGLTEALTTDHHFEQAGFVRHLDR